MNKTAIYPGSFDPPTNGHIDIVKRALTIFDSLIIGVSNNYSKKHLFNIKEREDMLQKLFENEKCIKVMAFEGLLVDFATQNNATAIIRGLRAVSDFEYELQIASMNHNLNKNLETLFMMASDENLFVSSSLIKEIVKLGGDVSSKIPPLVLERLKDKFNTLSK